MSIKKARCLSILLIPIGVLLTSLILNKSQDEYYLSHNSDPTYLYLINSLNVAMLQPVNHVDNPGTTVQMLGGLVIRVLARLRGTQDIEKDLILHPEFYLSAINKTILAIIITSLIVMGIFAFSLTKSIWLSLLLQGGVFSSWLSLKALPMVSPEPMTVFVSVMYSLLIVWTAEKKNQADKSALLTLLFAVVTALGLATKLTFLPFILAPIVILPGLKWKILFLSATALLFHVFLIPAYAHYDFLLHWVKLLALNSGPYGQGSPEIINVGAAGGNLLRLIILEHPFFIVLLLSIILMAFVLGNRELRKSLKDKNVVKITIALILTLIIHSLMVAKLYNPRYLLPSLMLTTTLVYLDLKVVWLVNKIRPIRVRNPILLKTICVLLLASLMFIRYYAGFVPGETLNGWMQTITRHSSVSEWIYQTFLVHAPKLVFFTVLFPSAIWMLRKRVSEERLNKGLTVCVIAIVVLYQFVHLDLPALNHRLENSKYQALAALDFVDGCTDCAVIYGERSSSKYYALKYGTSTNFTRQSQLQRMQELYPGKIYFWGLKHGQREFENWLGPVPLSEILEQNQKVIIQGDHGNLTPENINLIESANHVVLTPIFKGDFEAVHTVTRQ